VRHAQKTHPSDELKAMAEAKTILAEREQALYQAFLNYPKNQPAAGHDYYLRQSHYFRSTIRVCHRIAAYNRTQHDA
jgi:hypothetical protein